LQEESKTPFEADWVKAYDNFFRMVAGRKISAPSKTNIDVALPHIERIITIAQLYKALQMVQTAFTGLLLGYVEAHTLYSTSKGNPRAASMWHCTQELRRI
jgi:hypothetical protein